MPDPRRSTTRKVKHYRLWPLMFLPLVGWLAGLCAGGAWMRLPFGVGTFEPMGPGLLGLVAGCGAMVISASVVLALRVAQRQFTIGAILATIAVIALFLGWVRANLF